MTSLRKGTFVSDKIRKNRKARTRGLFSYFLQLPEEQNNLILIYQVELETTPAKTRAWFSQDLEMSRLKHRVSSHIRPFKPSTVQVKTPGRKTNFTRVETACHLTKIFSRWHVLATPRILYASFFLFLWRLCSTKFAFLTCNFDLLLWYLCISMLHLT